MFRMKKTIIGLMCATVVLVMMLPVFAADTLVLTETGPVVISPQKYEVKINGAALELGDREIVQDNGKIMVPLRVVSEALGFTVTWNNEKQAVHMDNGNVKTDLTIGTDLYVISSSKAIGMAAPRSLGTAPKIINENTYVPVDLYKLLYSNPDAVQINDNIIRISSEGIKSADDTAKVPNPLVTYNSIDEAKTAMNWHFAAPSNLPRGYGIKAVTVIDNSLAQVTYVNNDEEIVYRTEKGENDISGNYAAYEMVETVSINGMMVTVKGADANIELATWCKDGIGYSLQFGKAVDKETFTLWIKGIK